MFDDDQRVAEIAQVLQCRKQPIVISLVQPYARLVEDINHALKP